MLGVQFHKFINIDHDTKTDLLFLSCYSENVMIMTKSNILLNLQEPANLDKRAILEWCTQ